MTPNAPQSIFDPPGADLADKTSYIFHETSYTGKDYDAELAAFREAVSLASRPFKSTGPDAKKNRKGDNMKNKPCSDKNWISKKRRRQRQDLAK